MVIGGGREGKELARQWQVGSRVRVRHCRWGMRTVLAMEMWQPDMVVLDDRVVTEQALVAGFQQTLTNLFPLTPMVRASGWRDEFLFDIDVGYQHLGKIEFESSRWNAGEEGVGDQDWTGLLVGRSPAMQQVVHTVRRFGALRVPVLVQGEAGTGKRLVASALHTSRRAQGVLAGGGLRWVRCNELSESELDSLLFGERGRELRGLLNDRAVGSIVLQEVAAISPAVQLRLLDRMRSERFQVNGGEGPCLIFTTSEDLGRLVASRRVRADLFYELSGYLIGLPPLRCHTSDIPLFVDFVLESLVPASRACGVSPLRLRPSLMETIMLQQWPANVAQLRQFLFRAVMRGATADLSGDEWMSLMKLGGPRRRETIAEVTPTGAGSRRMLSGWKPRMVSDAQWDEPKSGEKLSTETTLLLASKWSELVDRFASEGVTNIYSRALEQFERGLLSEVLGRTGGNLNDSARLLGMTRVSLRNKLQSLAIPFHQ
jgi:two-component system nitrogen regulation response regulator GlnG